MSELRESSNDYKKFWKTIRSVILDDKGNVKQDILLSHDGKKLLKQDVAHFINSYFINIGRDTTGTPPTLDLDDDSDEATDNHNHWYFSGILQSEVFKVIKSVNVSKSSGIDNVSSLIIKDALTILLPQITHLFNLTL